MTVRHGEGPQHSGVGSFVINELGARVINEKQIYGYWEEEKVSVY